MNEKYVKLISNSYVKQKQLNLSIYFSNIRREQNTAFVVVESHSILYSSRIVYLKIDWSTRYNMIMIEH